MEGISTRFFGSQMEKFYLRRFEKKLHKSLPPDSKKPDSDTVRFIATFMLLVQRSAKQNDNRSKSLLAMLQIGLSLLSDMATAEAIIGDLKERHDDIQLQMGRLDATRWLYRQALSTIASFTLNLIRRISGWDRLAKLMHRRG